MLLYFALCMSFAIGQGIFNVKYVLLMNRLSSLHEHKLKVWTKQSWHDCFSNEHVIFAYFTQKQVVLLVSISVIVVHPKDRTVFLGDDGYFACLTQDSSTTQWRLNDTDYDDLPLQLLEDLLYYSAPEFAGQQLIDITITAKAKYNGTRLQCVAESEDGYLVVSKNATLIIQG